MRDSEWVRESFLVPSQAYASQEDYDKEWKRREFTAARYDFVDTTLGGSYEINPPPQYTRFADVPVKSRYRQAESEIGRYYYEALASRGQTVQIRAGIPQYTGLSNYFLNFFNSDASSLVTRGRYPSKWFYIGRAAGYVVSLPAQPLIWANAVVRFLSGKPASRFYYLKPSMHLYWSAVSNIANAIGVNMGVIGRGMSAGEQNLRPDDPAEMVNGKHLESKLLHDNMAGAYPNIFREDGGIDIFRLSTRVQRLAYINRQAITQAVDNAPDWPALQRAMKQATTQELSEPETEFSGVLDYLKQAFGVDANKPDNQSQNSNGEEEGGGFSEVGEQLGAFNENIADDDGFVDLLASELRDGGSFVTFRVNPQESVSETFSNSATESPLAQSMKGASSSARMARFSFADGNLGDGAFMGTLTSVIQGVRDMAVGAIKGVGLEGLSALAGSAYPEIPKVWEDASVDMGQTSYTIHLRSPHGTPFARFQNLMIPVSMLLAMVLPMSAGKQAYGQPLLVEAYSKGRQQTRMGLVTNMTFTRGVGNLGWTKDGHPLGIDVEFTIMDLSTALHMPITANFGVGDALNTYAATAIGAGADAVAGAAGFDTNLQDTAVDVASLLTKSTFDDDNMFTDYMAVMGSLSLEDQIYPSNKLRLRRAQRQANWQRWKSKAYYASWFAGTAPGEFAKSVIMMTDENAGVVTPFD